MTRITGAPRRQARSVANDLRILDAVVNRLDEVGWEETSILQVAQQAGLSHPAVLARYAHRTAAVADAWTSRLAPVILDALAACIEAVDRADPELDDDEGSAVLAALEPFAFPAPEMRAGLEVILVARYQPDLAALVNNTVGTRVEEWLTPRHRSPSRAHAARRAYLLTVALGCTVEARRRLPEIDLDLSTDAALIARALRQRRFPARLPAQRAKHLTQPPTFDTEDPALVALLSATLDEVGEVGYEAATLQRIAKAAGHTTGLIFRRYDGKKSLFLDATSRMLVGAGAANQRYIEHLEQATSPGIAEATMTREFMRPELKRVRTITFEQYRMSWHDDEMKASFAKAQEQVTRNVMDEEPWMMPGEARARAFLALSQGAGVGLLADLCPTAWTLPYDVVTVPFREERRLPEN